jgi:hypothetical protein
MNFHKKACLLSLFRIGKNKNARQEYRAFPPGLIPGQSDTSGTNQPVSADFSAPVRLTVAEVHSDFKTDPQVFIGWFSPHSDFLLLL